MGPHDGEWIRDEVQPPGGRPTGSETPGEEWPPGTGEGRGHGGAPGFSVRAAVAVAVLAAVAGVAAGFFLVRGTPAASAAGRATPSARSVPAPAGSGTGQPGNGNAQLEVLLTGRVLAVSATSITIGGAGPSVTAAVTGATKITGTVRGIGGVKVGDEISAQLTGTASHLAATAIQDPASQ